MNTRDSLKYYTSRDFVISMIPASGLRHGQKNGEKSWKEWAIWSNKGTDEATRRFEACRKTINPQALALAKEELGL